MLIALSGVQGSGKTTVLNGLKDLGYNIIERKTARSILADWDLTLEQVYDDRETSKRFHDELLTRKLNDELDAVQSNNLYFTERSFADVFTYACVCLGHFNTCSAWLNQFYINCKSANASYLGVFFLNAPNNLPTEDDGVRGINPHYVKQVNDIVSRVSREFKSNGNDYYNPIVNPLLEVTHNQVDQRVRFVADNATDLWLTKRLKITQGYGMCHDHPLVIESNERHKSFSLSSQVDGVFYNNTKPTEASI